MDIFDTDKNLKGKYDALMLRLMKYSNAELNQYLLNIIALCGEENGKIQYALFGHDVCAKGFCKLLGCSYKRVKRGPDRRLELGKYC